MFLMDSNKNIFQWGLNELEFDVIGSFLMGFNRIFGF